MKLGAGASGRGIAVDASPHDQGTDPEVGASRRGWTVLGGLFLLGAAPRVLIWVTLENSQGHLAENVVETLVLISAALAIGGIALIAAAAFSWAFRNRGG